MGYLKIIELAQKAEMYRQLRCELSALIGNNKTLPEAEPLLRKAEDQATTQQVRAEAALRREIGKL